MEVSGKRPSKDKNVGTAVTDTLCEPCQDIHVTTSANGVCRECKEYMCNTCFQHHLKARQCRNHVLVDAGHPSASSDRAEDLEKCKHHGEETIKYYCRMHNVVGCGDCMISGHGACKPEFIKDISEDFKENDEFKSLVRKLEKMTSAIKDSEKKIQDDKREVMSMHERAIRELREFRTDIIEYLDNAEDELNRLRSKNESLLTQLGKNCKLLSIKLAEIKKETNAEIYHGRSLFIHSVECKPKVLESENAIAQLQVEFSNIEKITFVPDQRLLNIIAPKLNLKRAGFEVPAFVRTKQDSQKSSDSMADQKSRNDKVTVKKEEMTPRANPKGTKTRAAMQRCKEEDIKKQTSGQSQAGSGCQQQ
ncbi:E3 ubiquitin-protein ligase TRIM33-like [Mercenaria mercenaria]|uniref:E3 ubiquitin-protein ligase TRIM33-like n=1 Tax=Mercenaria mercenaria TaxID=6596 RepID=UPI00234E823D|nr:E3 ubiquitin-protein ligase TRIM33-like [Mercenaria mercenaria]